MNFSFNDQDRQINRKLMFKLTEKERAVYERLKKEVPTEKIVVHIGQKFSTLDYNSITPETVNETFKEVKANAVLWQRKIEIAKDVLTAIKRSEANPKMLLKIFFENDSKNTMVEPNWYVMNVLHSSVGLDFVSMSQQKAGWLNSLPLKQKYLSEWELIEPLLYMIGTEEGRKFIEHLYGCKATICRCKKGKKGMDALIKKTEELSKDLDEQYRISNALIKEDIYAASNFVRKMMDVYHVTNMIFALNKKDSQYCDGTQNQESNEPEQTE